MIKTVIEDKKPSIQITISLESIQDMHSLHGLTVEECVDAILEPVKMGILKHLRVKTKT
jgi:hypothetical protein